jgi:hypothetical protein
MLFILLTYANIVKSLKNSSSRHIYPTVYSFGALKGLPEESNYNVSPQLQEYIEI